MKNTYNNRYCSVFFVIYILYITYAYNTINLEYTWPGLEPKALRLAPLSATACQVVLLLVLMASWMSCPQLDRAPSVDMVELFAGTARCAKAARLAGKHAIALDLEFDSKVRPGAMNINSSSGYLLLSCPMFFGNGTVLINMLQWFFKFIPKL